MKKILTTLCLLFLSSPAFSEEYTFDYTGAEIEAILDNANDWDDGNDLMDGEKIAAGTIDDDSLDLVDITLNDFTFDVGSVSKTEFGYLDGVTASLSGFDSENEIEAFIFDADAENILGNWVNTTYPWAVNEGGTGAATFTDGGILLGSGTGAITALGVATNGQIPIGDGTTDPTLATITGTANEITVTNGAGSITLSLPDSVALTGSTTSTLTTTAVGGATGLYSYGTHTTNALTGELIGVRGNARVDAIDSPAGTVIGGKFQAGNMGTGTDLLTATGVYVDVVDKIPSGATTWTNARGYEVSMDLDQGSAGNVNTITNAYMFYGVYNLPTVDTYATVTNGYGIFVRNEAVGGTGQMLDAAFYADDLSHSGGIYGWDFGLDFSGIASGAFGTADIRGVNGETISNNTDGTWDFGASNIEINTGHHITVGAVQWDDGSDKIDGEQIADNTIDDDSIDFTDVTLADITLDADIDPDLLTGDATDDNLVDEAIGGLGSDVSALTGIVGFNAGVLVDVDTASELEQLAGLGEFFSEYADDASASNMRTTLGLAIGTDVQAYDTNNAETDNAETVTAAWEFQNGVTIDAFLYLFDTPLTGAPTPADGYIYCADNSSWDPITYTGSVPYLVIYDGSDYIGLWDKDGNMIISSLTGPIPFTGGGGSIDGDTTTLTSAQVNALKASPITLIAAQGSNTIIEVESVILTYDYATAAFTVAGDEDFVIEYADGTDITASIETTGFLDQADDEVRFMPSALAANADLEACINQAVRIFNTGAGETADGGGELDIRINYKVYSTGF